MQSNQIWYGGYKKTISAIPVFDYFVWYNYSILKEKYAGIRFFFLARNFLIICQYFGK